MTYFPALLNIDYKKVVVVGGGNVAAQKVRALLPTKANIHIISPDLIAELASYVQEGRAIWHEKQFAPHDVDDAVLVFATTNSEAVNDAVEEATQHWQQFSRADMKGRVDFINPAVVRRGELILAVSTSGASPGYTRKLKAELEEQFDESYAQYIAFLKHCRQQINATLTDKAAKRKALQQTLRPEVFDWLQQGDVQQCEAFLQNLLNGEQST
ncbi:precorrin-2 dehydrogenase/sirohydrochlorin ferrochelatase family protein [Metasolibacillus meyeri]|uniref:precorrin-2 dehydrogenase/sirohydrochlorin ferrochelatase family protein n=1 Tax=Metasolibacillus meyeri TaxID=1071052 RepID=UPI000D325EA2|nr:NAD(P)-dependent oxidoreductase [Metasolibacillus meyeri]